MFRLLHAHQPVSRIAIASAIARYCARKIYRGICVFSISLFLSFSSLLSQEISLTRALFHDGNRHGRANVLGRKSERSAESPAIRRFREYRKRNFRRSSSHLAMYNPFPPRVSAWYYLAFWQCKVSLSCSLSLVGETHRFFRAYPPRDAYSMRRRKSSRTENGGEILIVMELFEEPAGRSARILERIIAEISGASRENSHRYTFIQRKKWTPQLLKYIHVATRLCFMIHGI